MLSVKQLKDIAKCGEIKDCKQCSAFRYCVDEFDLCKALAETALVYREMLEQLEWIEDENGRLFDRIEVLQQENEQLRAQTARMKDACIKGFSYLSLLFHRADIRNWNDVGMCSVKDVKHVLDELASAYKDESADKDYHNPADVEVLRKTREALYNLRYTLNYFRNESSLVPRDMDKRHIRQAEEALAEIDKVIGGGKDE